MALSLDDDAGHQLLDHVAALLLVEALLNSRLDLPEQRLRGPRLLPVQVSDGESIRDGGQFSLDVLLLAGYVLKLRFNLIRPE